MAHVSPFAGHRADRARKVSGRPPCQEVGEIHELPSAGVDFGPVLLQPKQLGRLHLGRDAATHILEDRVARRVDALGLLKSAMVHPDHDVPFGMRRVADRKRRPARTKHDK